MKILVINCDHLFCFHFFFHKFSHFSLDVFFLIKHIVCVCAFVHVCFSQRRSVTLTHCKSCWPTSGSVLFGAHALSSTAPCRSDDLESMVKVGGSWPRYLLHIGGGGKTLWVYFQHNNYECGEHKERRRGRERHLSLKHRSVITVHYRDIRCVDCLYNFTFLAT